MLFPPLPKQSLHQAEQAKQARPVWSLPSAQFMRQTSGQFGSPAATTQVFRRAARLCAAGAVGLALTFGVFATPQSANAQTTGQVINTDDVDKLMKTTTTQPTAGGSGGGGASAIQINPTPALLTPVALPAANGEETPTTKKKKKKKSTKPKTTKSQTTKPETVKVVAVLDKDADATDPATSKSGPDAKSDGKTDKTDKTNKSNTSNNTDGKSGSKADASKDDKADTKKSDAKNDEAKKDDTKKVTASTIEPAKEGGIADSTWAALRKCESGGNYKINTGNGYYGAYQFSAQTWRSLGYPGLPHQAEPEVQDEAARRLQAKAGWGQWPACSRKLGLR